jgi:hypothetical protein
MQAALTWAAEADTWRCVARVSIRRRCCQVGLVAGIPPRQLQHELVPTDHTCSWEADRGLSQPTHPTRCAVSDWPNTLTTRAGPFETCTVTALLRTGGATHGQCVICCGVKEQIVCCCTRRATLAYCQRVAVVEGELNVFPDVQKHPQRRVGAVVAHVRGPYARLPACTPACPLIARVCCVAIAQNRPKVSRLLCSRRVAAAAATDGRIPPVRAKGGERHGSFRRRCVGALQRLLIPRWTAAVALQEC